MAEGVVRGGQGLPLASEPEQGAGLMGECRRFAVPVAVVPEGVEGLGEVREGGREAVGGQCFDAAEVQGPAAHGGVVGELPEGEGRTGLDLGFPEAAEPGVGAAEEEAGAGFRGGVSCFLGGFGQGAGGLLVLGEEGGGAEQVLGEEEQVGGRAQVVGAPSGGGGLACGGQEVEALGEYPVQCGVAAGEDGAGPGGRGEVVEEPVAGAFELVGVGGGGEVVVEQPGAGGFAGRWGVVAFGAGAGVAAYEFVEAVVVGGGGFQEGGVDEGFEEFFGGGVGPVVGGGCGAGVVGVRVEQGRRRGE